MAGNKVLQILRGTKDKINQCNEPLISGQLLYNMTDNFLYCGKDNTAIKDTLPIHTNVLKDGEAKTAYISATTNQLSIVADTTINIDSNTCEFSSNTNTVFKGKTESTVIPSTATEVVRLKEIQDLDLGAVTGNGFIKAIEQVDGKVSATTSDVATTLKVVNSPVNATDVVRYKEIDDLELSLVSGDGFIKNIKQVNGLVTATTSSVATKLKVTTAPTISANSTDVVRGNELAVLDFSLPAADGFINSVQQVDGQVSATSSTDMCASGCSLTFTSTSTDKSKTASISVNSDGNIVVTADKLTCSGGGIQAEWFNASSDRRLKTNISLLNTPKSILDLPIYEFDYINSKHHTIGCMAQDLQAICPQVVHMDADGFLSIEENKLIYLLLLEVQKLKTLLEVKYGCI